ncbi:MAG: Ig-like domain-containing protein, partial [Gemmatimonadales bacterium]
MSLRLSRRWYRATWLLLVAACQSDAPVTTPPPPGPVAASIAVISGDAQHADPLDALAEPVRFQVRDSAGQVMAGVMVQFTATIGGGSVDVASSVTDSAGIAQMRWTMGELGGEQALQARVYRSEVVASASATTCNPSDCFPPKRLSSTLSDATLLNLATYEGSGQTVHPDVVRGHRGATGFWLAITPYPGGNSTYENPSIYHSRDAKTWIAPADVANPIARPDPGGYLSDPALVVDRDQHLWLYYRGVVQQQNIISVIHSTNGSKWDAPIAVVTVPSHQAVSPTVVRGAPGAPWQMWSV